jgi:hypothetical protein
MVVHHLIIMKDLYNIKVAQIYIRAILNLRKVMDMDMEVMEVIMGTVSLVRDLHLL